MSPSARVLNTRAAPALWVVNTWSVSSPVVTTYIDPADDRPFSAASLTSTEKGMVVEKYPCDYDTLGAGTAAEHHTAWWYRFPLKFADKLVAEKIQQLCGRAYGLTRRPANSGTQQPARYGLDAFIVGLRPADELDQFLVAAGWTVESRVIDEEGFVSALISLLECLNQGAALIATARAARPFTGQPAEELRDLSAALEELRRPVPLVVQDATRLRSYDSILAFTSEARTDPLVCRYMLKHSALVDSVGVAIRQRSGFTAVLDALQRDIGNILHPVPIPTPTLDLQSELSYLSETYTAMRYISGKGRSVHIDLPTGVSVILHEDRVEVVGDVTKLTNFKVARDQAVPQGRRSRFASLMTRRDDEEGGT